MSPLDEVIRHSPVMVHPERYVVAQVHGLPLPTGHFAVFTDDCETTVVTIESRLSECKVSKAEGPFGMLEFRVAVPFEAPGFLAAVCARLAERSINVLVYSTFSRDYVLVPWGRVSHSIEALRAAGFTCAGPGESA